MLQATRRDDDKKVFSYTSEPQLKFSSPISTHRFECVSRTSCRHLLAGTSKNEFALAP